MTTANISYQIYFKVKVILLKKKVIVTNPKVLCLSVDKQSEQNDDDDDDDSYTVLTMELLVSMEFTASVV